MADLTISDLFETTTPQPTDYIPVVNTGATRKVSIDNLVKVSQYALDNAVNITATTSVSAPALSGNHYGVFIGDGTYITNVAANINNLVIPPNANLTVTGSVSAPSLSGTFNGTLPILHQNVTVVGNISATGNIYAGSVINVQAGTSYTLANTDNSGTVFLTNAGSTSLIVPPSITTPGYEVAIIRGGTGIVTITPGSGVTIRQSNNIYRLAAQYSAATLLYINSTVGWVLFGDLTA